MKFHEIPISVRRFSISIATFDYRRVPDLGFWEMEPEKS